MGFGPIPDHQSSEYWETIVTLQGAVKELFSYDFFSGLLSRLSPRQRAAFSKKKPAPQDEAWLHIETIWWVGKRRESPYSVKMIPIANTQPLCLLLKILKLLDGLPSHVITQCSGCDNLFLNPTLKEKRFCSNRCMWRVNTRNRREANREAYNQYQKELMQARYREEKGHRPIRKKPTAEHVAAEKGEGQRPGQAFAEPPSVTMG